MIPVVRQLDIRYQDQDPQRSHIEQFFLGSSCPDAVLVVDDAAHNVIERANK